MTKKLLVATLIVAAIALSAPLARFVEAQTVDLGVDNVGLLPSNPFYFLKEWGRGVRKFFISSGIRKAQVELEVLNEKAAELEKLIEITPYNKPGVATAFANYTAAADNLAIRLGSFTETTANPEIEKLTRAIIERGILHQRLFDQLFTKFLKDELALEAVRSSSEALARLLAVIVEKLDTAADFRVRFQSIARAGTGSLRAFSAAELADHLGSVLPDEPQIRALKGDILMDLDGHLEGLLRLNGDALSERITMLPGDHRVLLSLIDEAREITPNDDLHNALNFTRQGVIDLLVAEKQLNVAVVAEAIDRVKSLIAENTAMGSTRATRESMQRAKFNLDQAEKFLQEDNLAGAFGQANAAYAAAKDAWYLLMAEVMANSEVVDSLKLYYDTLVSSVKSDSFPGDNNPEVFALLNKAEKQLLGVSKLIEGEARPEVVFEAMKQVRIVLSLTDELIQQALHPAPKPAEAEPVPAMRSASEIPDSLTVVISAKGFSPALVTVKPGTKVTWFNKDLQPHWPASDPHPTHADYPSFDSKNGLSQGETFSFVFDKVGHWGYHDNLNPELTGAIEVKE